MRLLYITQMYPSEELPQYCVFLHLQVKALLSQGIEISVIVPTTTKESKKKVFDGVEVIYLSYHDYSRSIMYGLVNYSLNKTLRDFVNPYDYDIVYAIHAPANILYFARYLSKEFKKPLIVHYRGYNIFEENEAESKAFLSNPKKIKEKVVVDSALSIGVSHKTVDIITKRFPEAPVDVVYNGVDANVFTHTKRESYHDDSIHILCVANLIPIKGHRYLFEAVEGIVSRNPNLNIIIDIVGRGCCEEELKDYVQAHSTLRVSFHGYVHHDRVAEFMQSTDIFVLPSVYESFGNVCLEAMACQVPIVIFEDQGIDEIIEDGVSGMIAKKGDAQDLAEKIEKLILDKQLRDRIAENGYRVAQQFTWDKSAKSIIQAIRRVTDIV